MRYFLHLAYNGEKYHGWQRQLSVRTVQQVIEDKLALMLHHPVIIHGCGRTDAGVHADQYFAHFDTDTVFDYDPLFRINKMLPDDISIFEIIPVKDNANTRHHAFRRTYNYFIHLYKDPFLNPTSTLYLEKDLDLLAMKQGAEILTKYNDFRSLCKSPDKVDHTRCGLTSARLFTQENGQLLRFEIISNRFLRSMIRIIVSDLMEIGKGNLSIDTWETLIANKEERIHKSSAPPQGLHLSRIEYRDLDIKPKRQYLNWTEV